jgi:hypothetical protein
MDVGKLTDETWEKIWADLESPTGFAVAMLATGYLALAKAKAAE